MSTNLTAASKQGPALRAYNNDPALKADLLKQMRAHREADELVRGHYWNNGKGCAVGCLTKNPYGGHKEYEKWGIPEELAHLEDAMFEDLSKKKALAWPERFLLAIPIGADLSSIWHQWFAEILRMDLLPLKEVLEDTKVMSAIEAVAVLHERSVGGSAVKRDAWRAAAVVARDAFSGAVGSTSFNAARSAFYSASARPSGNALRDAVRGAVMSAVWGATWDEDWDTAKSAVCTKMVARLIRLLKKARA